jgi:hypothetical protein
VIDSLANPGRNQSLLMTGCSTGNCTFPITNGVTHSTVGMCSTCSDMTSQLEDVDDGLVRLPNGLYMRSGRGEDDGILTSFNTSTSCIGAPSGNFTAAQTSFQSLVPASVMNFTVISAAQSGFNSSWYWGLNYSLIAATCIFYPCMRHYAGVVEQGVFEETLVSTVAALPIDEELNEFSSTKYYAGINASCLINEQLYDLTRIQPDQITIQMSQDYPNVTLTLGSQDLLLPSDCINQIDGIYAGSAGSFLFTALTGTCVIDQPDGISTPQCKENSEFSSDMEYWWLLGDLWNGGNATFGTIQSTLDAVVESITARMRVQGYDPRTNRVGLVNGTVIETSICISFSWQWLLYPGLFIGLTGVCLLGTLIQSTYQGTEVPPWKSSILPLLYASPGSRLAAPGDICSIEESSKTTMMKLERDDDRWAFVDALATSRKSP